MWTSYVNIERSRMLQSKASGVMSFHVIGLFYSPRIQQISLWFYDVCRKYRKRQIAWNGLIFERATQLVSQKKTFWSILATSTKALPSASYLKNLQKFWEIPPRDSHDKESFQNSKTFGWTTVINSEAYKGPFQISVRDHSFSTYANFSKN